MLEKYHKYVLKTYRSELYWINLQPFVGYMFDNQKELYIGKRENVEEYLNYLKSKELNREVMMRYRHAVKKFYHYLWKNRVIPKTEWEAVNSIPPLPLGIRSKQEAYRNTLSIGQLNYFIQKITLKSLYKNTYYIKTLLYFFYYTGIRVKELMRLKRSDIDLENKRVKLPDRYLYFPELLKELMIKYFETEPEVNNAFNFTRAKYEQLNDLMKKYTFQEKTICFGYFRDSFINLLIKKGVDLPEVHRLSGNRFLRETLKYFISNDKKTERAYKKRIK